MNYKIWLYCVGDANYLQGQCATLAEARETMVELRNELIGDGSDGLKWQLTQPLRKITSASLLLGSEEYGSMCDMDNVGSPVLFVERKTIWIEYSEDEIADY